MPPRRRTTVRRGQGSDRKKVWARETFTDLAVTTAAPVGENLLSSFESALGSSLIGATVARVRGLIAVIQTAGSAPGIVTGALGVVPAGVPIADLDPLPHYDWFAWWPFITRNTAAFDGTGVREVDVRSMRKVEELDQQVQIIFSAVEGGTSPAWTINYHLSTLVMLP